MFNRYVSNTCFMVFHTVWVVCEVESGEFSAVLLSQGVMARELCSDAHVLASWGIKDSRVIDTSCFVGVAWHRTLIQMPLRE